MDTNITTKNNTIVIVNIPKASGSETVSNQINTEIQKTIVSALQIGNPNKISSTVEENIDSFNNEFDTFLADFPEAIQLWEAQIDGEVMYQSSKITSIAITSFINTGGAHGDLTITFLNFDSETGQKIENEQLFNNVEAVKKIAKTYFEEATKDDNILLDNLEFTLAKNIGYGEDGVVLLYNTYEIAPYTSGIIEFVIPYDDIGGYLVFNSL